MQPYTVRVRECEYCKAPIKQTLIYGDDGNLYNLNCWTDGKTEIRSTIMFEFQSETFSKYQPRIVLCRTCESAVWLEDLKTIDEIEDWHGRSIRPNDPLPYLIPPFERYMAFLNNAQLPEDRMLHIRLFAWWGGNDYRRIRKVDAPLCDLERSNLNFLVNEFDDAVVEDRVLKAEAYRELGQFDKCIALVKDFPASRAMHHAKTIYEHALVKCAYVRQWNP